jgi:hypothetical protein
MRTTTRKAHQKLIDITRMEDAAMTAGRSAEALFGYLSRLDAMRDADLSREALAERAAEAELHMRVVLSCGMDALNELQDLGLIEHSLRTTAKDPVAFNEVSLTEALAKIAEAFRLRIPSERWNWLEVAGRLVEGVEVRVEKDPAGLRGTITHSGESTVVRFDPEAPATRVSTSTFFSNGPDQIYVPTSAIFSSIDKARGPVAAYDAAVGGMAFTREWVYRHARNAAELGPPARSGGGPVAVVILIVVAVVATLAAIAAAILGFACEVGAADWTCRWSVHLSTLAGFLAAAPVIVVIAAASGGGSGQGSQRQVSSTGQPPMSYGTNPQ